LLTALDLETSLEERELKLLGKERFVEKWPDEGRREATGEESLHEVVEAMDGTEQAMATGQRGKLQSNQLFGVDKRY
jgi:hypothetical protein